MAAAYLGTRMMGAEELQAERVAFERAISGPPYERDVSRYPDDHTVAWPGNYKDYPTDLAWALWRERAALAAQPAPVNAPAEADLLLRVIQRLNSNPYSLTKSECISEVQAMRDAAIAAATAQAQPTAVPATAADMQVYDAIAANYATTAPAVPAPAVPDVRIYWHAFNGWQVEWLTKPPSGGQSNFYVAAPQQAEQPSKDGT
jgi:hypothetical protein